MAADKELTLHDKLVIVQQELKAPKGQYNSFGKYNYRSCEDILEAVKPILKKLELTLTLNDELVLVGDRYYVKATATLRDSKTGIQNTAYAREEETKKGMDGSQITGASSSYARKYCLNGLLLIDDVKDSDFTNGMVEMTLDEAKNYVLDFGKHKGKKLIDLLDDDGYINYLLNNSNNPSVLKAIELLTGQAPKTEEQWDNQLEKTQKLMQVITEKGIDTDRILEHYHVKNLNNLTEEQIDEMLNNWS